MTAYYTLMGCICDMMILEVDFLFNHIEASTKYIEVQTS